MIYHMPYMIAYIYAMLCISEANFIKVTSVSISQVLDFMSILSSNKKSFRIQGNPWLGIIKNMHIYMN